ncbi:MAG: methyl-accepting chemotaxis protein [Planctomycetes bacterium]|nr:methyl-accepting chemotaxis protein [Planctomycetota bacterium]
MEHPMRVLGPVTGREVELRDDDMLVSRTDPRGVIIFANDAFVRVSGFSREELLGSPHNIVRHPDMPAAAFADLWATIQAGRTWVGMVKNRCKNGDHYWVRATVSPQYAEGRLLGYISIRSKPSREEVAAAEALYARMRAGARIRLRGGSRAPQPLLAALLSLRGRVLTLAAAGLLFFLGSIAAGWWALERVERDLLSIYEERLVPLGRVGAITADYYEIYTHVGCLASEQGDPLQHAAGLREHWQSLERALRALAEQSFTEEERALLARLQGAVARLGSEVVQPILKAGEAKGSAFAYSVAATDIWTRGVLGALIEEVDAVLSALRRHEEEAAQATIVENQERQRRVQFAWLLVAALCTLLAIGVAASVAQRLRRRIDALEAALERVAGGERRVTVDLTVHDELTPLFRAVAAVQTNLAYGEQEAREARRAVLANFDASVGRVLTEQRAGIARIDAAAQTQATTAKSLVANVQSVAAAANELNASIKEIANQASQVSGLTREAAGLADNSRQTMQGLSAATADISGVASFIADIAEQTNLLALNATIEAARAGEAGRGFAVVANEVKALAVQTQRATGEIADKLAAVRRDSEAAVQAFSAISAAIGKANTAVQAIAAAVEEQSAVVDEVARNAKGASQGARALEGEAQQVAEAARSLRSGSQALDEALQAFQRAADA